MKVSGVNWSRVLRKRVTILRVDRALKLIIRDSLVSVGDRASAMHSVFASTLALSAGIPVAALIG
jgi:hypothetical protein